MRAFSVPVRSRGDGMQEENTQKGSEKPVYSCILVDDDPWALQDMRRVLPLEELGFRIVKEASNAKDALTAIGTLRPELVITDISLGGMSGLEMIAKCRENGFVCEYIVISGYSDFEYARQAIHEDVSTYLLKPIDTAESREALLKVRGRLDGRPVPAVSQRLTIEKVRDYIRDNYQSKCSLDDVADIFFMNRTYLSELFRETFGKNFVQYKNEVRVEHAKILLTDTRLSISQIAARCGFDNTSYFALVFRQITGFSPVQWRGR